MKKKVLFIGGEGFIGRNLADFLSGSFECYSLGRSKSIFANKSSVFIEKDPYKDQIKNDYDVMVHLIDNKIDEGRYKNKELDLARNINLNKQNHLILFSSAVIYANPNSDYGKRKIKMEEFYVDYCRENGINLTILRLFNTYGPYQLPNKQGSFIAIVLVNFLNKEVTNIKDINTERDFIFSGDISKAVKDVIDKKNYGMFDLASNRLISIKEILEIVEDVTGSEVKINNQKEIEQIKSPTGNSALINKNKLISLDEGIKTSLSFYKKNLDLINGLN